MGPLYNSIQSFPLNLGKLLASIPLFILGIMTLGIPIMLYAFKQANQFLYGVCEVLFSIVLGFLSAIKLTTDTEVDRLVALLAFFSAMYVGARGWQNINDA